MKAARWASAGLALAACEGLGNFTDGLDLERCEDTYPICQTSAGCVLGESRYIEGRFPGSRQVIVNAPAESVIHVDIFFVAQTSAGIDTEIRWHEPGCFDTYRWTSEGRDIFLEAGRERILSQSQQVFQDGEHLVEVFSDAVAEFRLRVRVEAPGD